MSDISAVLTDVLLEVEGKLRAMVQKEALEVRNEEREKLAEKLATQAKMCSDAGDRFLKKAAECRKLDDELASAHKERDEYKRQRDVMATEIRKLKKGD
jgi:hypothetical protein